MECRSTLRLQLKSWFQSGDQFERLCSDADLWLLVGSGGLSVSKGAASGQGSVGDCETAGSVRGAVSGADDAERLLQVVSCAAESGCDRRIKIPPPKGTTRFVETRDIIRWEPSARDVTSERIGMPHGRTTKFPD